MDSRDCEPVGRAIWHGLGRRARVHRDRQQEFVMTRLQAAWRHRSELDIWIKEVAQQRRRCTRTRTDCPGYVSGCQVSLNQLVAYRTAVRVREYLTISHFLSRILTHSPFVARPRVRRLFLVGVAQEEQGEIGMLSGPGTVRGLEGVQLP